ncbi:MAG: RNA polymerase sigma factor [Myxococcales bacterium]|nr:RNA polymerase sigma factor [Myxococcales bacterium]
MAMALEDEQPDPKGLELKLASLYRENRGTVARWIRRRLPRDADVDDVVQEIFLTAWRSLSRFRGEGQLSTWLFVIAQRKASSLRREASRHVSFIEHADVAPEIFTESPRAEESLERYEALRLMQVAFGGLTASQRDVIGRVYLEEQSTQVVAAALGISITNVGVRLFRARRALAHALVSNAAKRESALDG